jgi:CubicO group peptidase (beta-lactamase class C family)
MYAALRHEAFWDRTSGETRADLDRARAHARMLVSLSTYRVAGEARHATVWSAGSEEQRFEADVPLEYVAGVLSRHARDGFHPALVGMVGAHERPERPEDATLTFVLERPPAGAKAPVFVPPRPFRDDDGTFFVTRIAAPELGDAGLLRCIAVAGEPRDARGRGLLVAGVLAPQPATRVAWAVHLDALDPTCESWRDRWEPRVLETAARPVQAIPIVTRAGARWVISLWHDRLLAPWPAPDPFAQARRFEADEALGTAALERAVAERSGREDRRVLALGAGEGPTGTSFLALYGSPGTEEPLRRRFVVVAPGDEVLERVESGDVPSAEPEHPLDRWVLQHMRETGARQGQLVIVRGRRLAFARAYTYAEAGYPVARLEDAMRVGSVSKALTTAALLPALHRRGVSAGIDARVVDLLGVTPGDAQPWLGALTVRHLLTHDAGLRERVDLDAPLAAPPGELSERLATLHDGAIFTRAPGGGLAKRLGYSNQGFILLGEILALLERGRADAYEAAIVDALLRPAGVDPGDRGCLLGAGRRRARARREAPAHPSSPTWAEKRFTDDDLDEGPLVLAPYADSGVCLGGAAGWCVPLLWLARVFAALGPRSDGGGLWRRDDAELAATPAAPSSAQGHGFQLAEPGFWTVDTSPCVSSETTRRPTKATFRVVRIAHGGRVEGGAALLLHQMPHPLPEDDDALDATLTIALAFNQLGALYADPHGRQLLDIARRIEIGPGMSARCAAEIWDARGFQAGS